MTLFVCYDLITLIKEKLHYFISISYHVGHSGVTQSYVFYAPT